jgi:WD40 repeat protein
MSETVHDDHLGEVLAAYLEAVDAGWAPDRRAFLARYPALRSELEAFFAAEDQVHTLSESIRADTPSANGVTAVPPTAAPRSFGDYELLEEIARGGMGVVFKARQVSLNRTVALKMVLAGDLASAGEVQRFRNEAEAAALMDHPNIVPVYDVGAQGGWHYFSMKLIEGGSLAQRLGRGAWTLGTKDDCRRAAALIATVARAVHYAHQRGILHRDLKPGNVLLGEQGEPLVTDFGLAKRLDETAGLTQTGAIVGTPGYMAPEQAAGKHRDLTTAADVYGLGAILYELLTGRPPFKGENVLDTLLQVREAKPLRPWALNPRVDADLETVCLKCLEKEPARRYASAEVLADDLERWQRGEPVRARRTGLLERTWKWARRRPGLALMTGFIAVCLVLSLAMGVGLYRSQTQKTRTEGLLALETSQRQTEERLRGEAQAAKETAEQERGRAQAQEALARRYLYFSRINMADRAWHEARGGPMLELLQEQVPARSGSEDPRGFEWYYLWRLAHSSLLTLEGHTGSVTCVCFSPDGKRMATGSVDQTVKLWDAATGQEVLSLRGHTAHVVSVCFSPDGKRLAAAAGDQAVKVWDAVSGQETLTLKGHTGNVLRVCFSPDGKRLASASVDKTVRVWDAATGQEVLSFLGDDGTVNDVCFSPDGKRLAAAPGDRTVRVWDAATGQATLTLKKAGWGWISGVCFSPDSKRLASVAADGVVKVWDAASGQEVLTLKGRAVDASYGGPAQPSRVCFSPDGTRLASASEGQTVKVWDAATGQEALTLTGHTGPISGVCFSPSGKRLASASEDKTVRVWDVTTDQEALVLKGHTRDVNGVCFSPDGKRLASTSADDTLRVWDVATGQEALAPQRHSKGVFGVCFSPDGQRLAGGSGDGTIRVWGAATGREMLALKPHSGRVTGVCFSPDGQRLAGGSDDGTIRVWDAATGREMLTLKGYAGVCFSPDGQRLAGGSGETIRVWDAATGREMLTLKGYAGGVSGLCFSPNGERLAAASLDYTVKVWDTGTGQEALIIKGHTGSVKSVCFSPDGKRLASAGSDATVRVWDAATGQETLTLKGHRGPISRVCFSSDGNRLASASDDGTLRIWDATPLPGAPPP